MTVETANESIELSMVTPDRLTLAKSQIIEQTDATLIVTINGNTRRTPIKLETPTEATREYLYQR